MSKLNANSVEMGSLTTAQRDALSSVATGTVIFNTTTATGQIYDGTGWIDFGDNGTKTYSVSPSTSSVNEGSSVTFTVTTGNVPTGTTLYWTTNVISGTVNASDFSDSATSGSFTVTGTIASGTGTIVRTLVNDVTTEGSESFQLQIRTGSTSGTIVATSSTVTINDTSMSIISATGGTKLTPGNGFVYHIWTSPGSLSISSGSGNCQLLVVGSGGDGGVCGGGGGGAGGVVVHPSLPLSGPYTFPVTVGASPGISPTGSPCGYRNDGNDSFFNNPGGPWSLVGKGGGRGGGADSQAGLPGGSGGGNSYPSATTGAATQPSQTHPGAPPGWVNHGNPGGQTPGSQPGKGGGGSLNAGGFEGSNPDRAWGGRAQSFPAFPGPLFSPMPSPWQSAVGPTGKFAGGGGASSGASNAEGGGSPGSGGSCIDNTGGGGGGGGTANRGASGVVIIRYPG